MRPQSIAILEAGFGGTLLALDFPLANHVGPADPSHALQSHVFEIDGACVGAAVRLDTFYRFIANDPRLEELDGTAWLSLAELQHLAHRLFRTGGHTTPSTATKSPARPDVGASVSPRRRQALLRRRPRDPKDCFQPNIPR